MSHQPLVEDAFLRARWQEEYESFKTSPEAKALLERLRSWAGREVLKETASEAAFIQRFLSPRCRSPTHPLRNDGRWETARSACRSCTRGGAIWPRRWGRGCTATRLLP